jgi:chromosome partitioning protein
VPGEEHLFVIPANDELEEANHALAASPMSLTQLRQRLYQIGEGVPQSEQAACNFGCIIVDPPPERSHLAMTALGAGDLWVIPAETNVKGVKSLKRTLQLLKTCQAHLPHGSFLGVLPFRAQWHGNHPTRTVKETLATMSTLVGTELMLPHLLHSDVYVRAINEQCLPRDFGKEELEYALLQLIERFRPVLGEFSTRIPLLKLEAA